LVISQPPNSAPLTLMPLRGQVGLSHVFSDVGGQMQPGGWKTGVAGSAYTGPFGGSHTGQPAEVRRQGKVQHTFIGISTPHHAALCFDAD
jgi:hypothetical protein